MLSASAIGLSKVMLVTDVLFAETTRVQIGKAILFHLFQTLC